MYKNPEVKTFEELERKQEKILGIFSNKFDECIKNAGIDKNQNEKWAEQYYNLKNSTNKIEKKIKRLKVWKWILLFPLVFPFFLMNSKQKKLQPKVDNNKEELNKLSNLLENQLNGIRWIFNFEWINQNVLSGWSDIKIDSVFSDDNANNLEDEYNSFMSETSNCQDLIAGEMFEHPFALFNKKEQLWKQEVYTSTVTLPYTVRMNGQNTTMFETIVGTYIHPAPFWNLDTKLVYKNSFNSNLRFTTNCSKKEFKRLEKTSHIKFENSEFNKNVKVIRNDETGIRVVFTPLAQESLNNLFKKQKYWLTKINNTTIVDLPDNKAILANPDLDQFDYSLKKWKENLSKEIKQLTNIIGIFSLPIANMPVYYQISNKDINKRNKLRLQAQSDMNYLYNCGIINFQTNVIFDPVESWNNCKDNINFNIYKINCHYFKPEHKTTTVMETSIHHGVVPITIQYIDYHPAVEILYLLKSTNYTNNGDLKNCYLHNGQIIAVSNESFSNKLKEIFK